MAYNKTLNLVVITILLTSIIFISSIPVAMAQGLSAATLDTTSYTLYIGDDWCNVTLFNTVSDSTIKVIRIVEGANPGGGVRDVAATGDGKKVYAIQYGDPYSLKVIDTDSGSVVASVPLEGGYFERVIISPDGKKVYVGGQNGLKVVDTATNQLTGDKYPVNGYTNIALSNDGKYLYVGTSNSLAVYDTRSIAEVAEVPVGTSPTEVKISPDGKKIYLTNIGKQSAGVTGNLTVIDASSYKVLKTIPMTGRANEVAISPDGSMIYVVVTHDNQFGSAIVVVDAATYAIKTDFSYKGTEVENSPDPLHVAVDPAGQNVYVLKGKYLIRMNADANAILTVIMPGNAPSVMAFRTANAAGGQQSTGGTTSTPAISIVAAVVILLAVAFLVKDKRK